jgi:hypothetical protein
LTAYNKNLSSQYNLTAKIESVQDKYIYPFMGLTLKFVLQWWSSWIFIVEYPQNIPVKFKRRL